MERKDQNIDEDKDEDKDEDTNQITEQMENLSITGARPKTRRVRPTTGPLPVYSQNRPELFEIYDWDMFNRLLEQSSIRDERPQPSTSRTGQGLEDRPQPSSPMTGQGFEDRPESSSLMTGQVSEEEDILPMDFEYFERMRKHIERENRMREEMRAQGENEEQFDFPGQQLVQKNMEAVQALKAERERRKRQSRREAFPSDRFRESKKHPGSFIRRHSTSEGNREDWDRKHLFPKATRTLDQIQRDMEERRRRYRSVANTHRPSSPGVQISPAVRRSRQLVDRSIQTLANRRRDPEFERRQKELKQYKRDWKGLKDRRAYRVGADYQMREINKARAKDLLAKRRRLIHQGQTNLSELKSKPSMKRVVPDLPKKLKHLRERKEPERRAQPYFPPEFQGYRSRLQSLQEETEDESGFGSDFEPSEPESDEEEQ